VGKRWSWVVWSMLAVFVVGYGLGVLLSVSNGNLTPDAASFTLAFAAFITVGSLIVAHRPGNAVGWIFSAIGLLAATGVLAMEYAAYAYLTRPGSLPGAALAAWYASWWWYPTFALIALFTPLVFPTRSRARSVPWCFCCSWAACSRPSSRWCCGFVARVGWSASSSSG
jgi:hypothetical protein